MDDTEKRIIEIIDENADELIRFGNYVYRHAEPGFREFETSRRIKTYLQGRGMEIKDHLAITGVKARLHGGGDTNRRVTVAAISELDGVSCPKHPFANPKNGVSHTCGHHCQMAAMLGAMFALTDDDVRGVLGGDVVFFAVPSEEYSDLDYKTQLMKMGEIKYGGGKAELIRIGEFDDTDIVITHHLHMVETVYDALLGYNTTNGFICKQVTFHGKASHAAIAPEKGVNALNAASIAQTALAYQRETFRERDYVRIHAIVTNGGHVVNAVPDNVQMEAQVRAKTMRAMTDACAKFNRSCEAGAHAVGAAVEIRDFPGYLPVLECDVPRAMLNAGAAVKSADVSVHEIDYNVHNCASTDVGDLTHILPVIGYTTGGFKGSLHSADFEITDEYKAYVMPAKIMALTVYNLLKNGGAEAQKVIESFPAHLTKQEYLDYMDSFDKK